MKLVILWMLAALGAFGLVIDAAAQGKGHRPTDLISADLGVSETAFSQCFADVQPAHDKKPSGAHQKLNKSILLPCLQAANPDITNRSLD